MNTNEVLRGNWREIRQKLGNLISWIDGQIDSLDAKEKRLEKLENESYIRGLNDMKEACLTFTAIDGGMSSSDIREYFEIEKGTPIDVDKIIEKSEAADFVERINKWKKDQEAEEAKADDIQVGDEITYDYFNGVMQVSGKGIVTLVESERIGTPVYVIHKGANSDTFYNVWINKDDILKKTGRHFDSIPFDYDGRFDE